MTTPKPANDLLRIFKQKYPCLMGQKQVYQNELNEKKVGPKDQAVPQ